MQTRKPPAVFGEEEGSTRWEEEPVWSACWSAFDEPPWTACLQALLSKRGEIAMGRQTRRSDSNEHPKQEILVQLWDEVETWKTWKNGDEEE